MGAKVTPINRARGDSAVRPLLRAVLLADLVDSTAFIQRFGDARAAVALRRLDLQIRDLLEFTGGRLIDKADGLLAIFERPVQAVDFALRYQQALRHFSSSEGVTLTARVGIHVGEVMTWSNSERAVAAGAKPLEVEGLAKPVAARLMSLALPGQILVSSMAQSLAQRAQAELGERAERVRWAVHGRYRFKGVVTPLLVHEVGELGFAPLRAPPSGQKVWRELPIWRRPPVVAAQLLLFLALGGLYGYTLLRSPPVLAFQQRDWVVVGDMSNFTGDPRLEESLDTALRISLEQSRFVNLVSELKVQEVLRRMGRSPQSSVDRAVGSEIALREGARALLLPSVAEVGGRLRVSVEVVDPNSQATVFAESAEGRGAESALTSLDTVNGQLRKRLGETLADIHARGKPLAQVTTGNLDALRLYSMAIDSRIAGNFTEAGRLLALAIDKDPEFALAYLARALIGIRSYDNAGARRDLALAQRFRDRLSMREALQLDANVAFYGPPQMAIDQWKTLARAYPDGYSAHLNAAESEIAYLQQYAQALRTLAPALNIQNPRLPSAWYMVGLSYTALEQYPQAQAAFDKYEGFGGRGFNRDHADMFAAQRRYADAEGILRKQDKTGAVGMDLDMRLTEVTYPLDRGEWDRAMAALAKLERDGSTRTNLRDMTYEGMRLSLLVVSERAAILPDLRQFQTAQISQAKSANNPDRDQALFAALYAAALAARLGDTAGAAQTADALATTAIASGYPANIDMLAIIRAEIALSANDPSAALAALQTRLSGGELYQLHETLMRVYRRQGAWTAALREVEWLSSRRGRAYVEWNSMSMLQPVNVMNSNLALLDGAELALSAGNKELARRWLGQFDRAWPRAEELPFLSPRLQALQSALNQLPGQTHPSAVSRSG